MPVLLVRPFGPSFSAVMRKFGDDERLYPMECSSTVEAVAKTRHFEWCFVLCHLASQDDLIKIATMMKFMSVGIKKKRMRVVVTIKPGMDHGLEANLKFYGASEVIYEPVAERAMLFKLERHIRVQHQQLGQSAGKTQEEAANPAAAAATAREASGRAPDGMRIRHQMRWGAPVTIQSDFWLTSRGEAKEIGDRWLVRLAGPSTNVGRWSKLKDSGDPGVWQWMSLTPDRDPFLKEPGAWFFKGQRPELQGTTWSFSGRAPDLSFGHDSKTIARKVFLDPEGNLVLAKDSQAALLLAPLIQESYNVPAPNKRGDGAPKAPGAEDEGSEGGDRHGERAGRSVAPPVQHRVRMIAPLTLRSDCWLIDARKPRRVASKWVVRLLGPGAAVGRWEAMEGHSGSRDSGWIWRPADAERDPFVREPGAWVFHGQSPKFQEDHWLFVGERPKLEFVYQASENKPALAKLHVDEHHVLQITKDSAQAEAYRAAILESYSKVIRGEDGKEPGGDLEAKERDKKRRGHEIEDPEGAPNSDDEEERGDDEDSALNGLRPKKKRRKNYTDDGEKAEADIRAGEGDEESGEESEAAFAARAKGKGRADADTEAEATELSANFPARKKSDRDDRDAALEMESAHAGAKSDAELDDLSLRTQGKPKKKGEPEDYLEKAKRRDASEMSIELDKPAEGKELSATLERPAQGKELSVTQSADAPGSDPSATQSADGEGKELSATQSRDGGGKERSASQAAASAGDDLQATRKSEGARRGNSDLGNTPTAATDAPIEAAIDPAKPTLGPIALACLVAELVMKRDMTRDAAARKYCDYVSKASGGMKVELWIQLPRAGGWRCASTNTGDPGTCPEAQLDRCLQSGAPLVEPGFIASQSGALSGAAAASVAGVLVISGPRAEIVPVAWASAAARFTVGLVAVFARELGSSSVLPVRAAA